MSDTIDYGIDLGTTNSLVATVRDDGIAIVLPDAEGRPLVPSIVHYGPSGVEVGYDAMGAQTRDPQNTLVSVKRLMGRGLADLADARRFPYRFVDAPGMVRVTTRAGEVEAMRSVATWRPSRSNCLASSRRDLIRYFIGGRPTQAVKRSTKAEGAKAPFWSISALFRMIATGKKMKMPISRMIRPIVDVVKRSPRQIPR